MACHFSGTLDFFPNGQVKYCTIVTNFCRKLHVSLRVCGAVCAKNGWTKQMSKTLRRRIVLSNGHECGPVKNVCEILQLSVEYFTSKIQPLRDFIEGEIVKHRETYDPDNMRDLVDLYIQGELNDFKDMKGMDSKTVCVLSAIVLPHMLLFIMSLCTQAHSCQKVPVTSVLQRRTCSRPSWICLSADRTRRSTCCAGFCFC